ncbi:MAG: N-acetylmuramoyl-L-alanine amidase [Planctomycetes bacterium]|nr:N-acetylmuramoyl-L-alanine amidase [Planctomycetota bacterium]
MRSPSQTIPPRPKATPNGQRGRRNPVAKPGQTLVWPLALLMLTLVACAAPRRSTLRAPIDSDTPYPSHSYRGGTPPWVGQENSWEKLEAINGWLATQGTYSEAYWRVEGRLQLAEGRMEFYRLERTSAGEKTNRQRISAARADFMRAKSDPGASEGQMRRAKRGLATSATVKKRQVSRLPDGVMPRSRWGARQAKRSNLTKAGTPWRFITIHHSALEKSIRSVGTQSGAKNALRKMQTFHMDSRNWGDLGYHFLIDPQGQVYEGRSMHWQGAHAGRGGNRNNNVGNIGICLIGNFDVDRPSAASLRSLKKLVLNLRSQHRIPAASIRGHMDWKQTECPGRNLLPFVRQLARG